MSIESPAAQYSRPNGNHVISVAVWTPHKNRDKGLQAAISNREAWGGWVFVSVTAPGYVVWFDSSYTPKEIYESHLTQGHVGRINPDRLPLEENRIFSGVYPEGIVYLDRHNNVDGDYKRLGFLSFRDLSLSIEDDCPLLLELRIREDAKRLQEARGESFPVSSTGKYIILGYGLDGNIS